MTGKTDTDKPKKTAFWRRSGKKESKTRDPNSQQPSQPISKAPKGKRLSEKEVLKAREEAQAKKQDVPEDAPPAYFAAEEPAATSKNSRA